MCFSATASFVTAGLTGVIGLVSLARADAPRAMPLAATPLLFALQQGIEGMLWLSLSAPSAASDPTRWTSAFLFFALVFWPVYAPIAVLLIEPPGRRRGLMRICLAIGAGVGAYMLWHTLAVPHSAVIRDGHIVYVTGLGHSPVMAPAYLAATSLPLLLSSQRTVVGLGCIILAGSVIAYVAYWEAFVSVWCIFAAVASLVIVFHFERSHRHRLGAAAA